MFSVSFTGYRPNKFPFSLEEENDGYTKLTDVLYDTLETLILNNGADCFYYGACYGFDIVAAETVIKLKEKYPQIKLVSVLPFADFYNGFSASWKRRAEICEKKTDEQIIVYATKNKTCFYDRNELLVNKCDLLVCFDKGIARSGTGQTVNKAKKQNKPIINIYESL